MKRLLIIAILSVLPFSVALKAQVLKPPVSVTMGQDLKADRLLVLASYDFTLTKAYSPDSTVTGQLVAGPSVLYTESNGEEFEGYGFTAAYDFPLIWKIRTELGAALYTLPVQGDNPEWVFVGAALSFAPNSALRLKVGTDYIRKSNGGSGPWVYGNLSFRIAK